MPPRATSAAPHRAHRTIRHGRHALSLSTALAVALALAVVGCTGPRDAAPDPSATTARTPSAGPPTSTPPVAEPAPTPSTPPLAAIDWVELVPPTTAHVQIRTLTPDRALFTEEVEHGTRMVEQRRDGSRSGRMSCVSGLDAGAAPGTAPRDVMCSRGPAQAWWLGAAADGTMSYLTSTSGGDDACAAVFRIARDEAVAPVEQIPCANRGWADSSYAVWTDPPTVGPGGVDWFRAELHAFDGTRVLDLGLAAAGSAVRCGDRVAWQSTVEHGQDQVRIWDPTHGTVVAYQSPLHDGYYSTIVGAILCADGAVVFPTLDADTNLTTYYAERSLGWTLDPSAHPDAA